MSQQKRKALAAGAAVAGGVVLAAAACSSSGSSTAASSSSLSVCNVTSVANQVLPSVVTISVKGPSGAGTGSGEVIRSNGYILTNNHVIAAAATGGTIDVQFSDGTTSPATLVGRDPLTDLAVIKVSTTHNLKVIAMGESSSVVVGQAVVVLGAPLGLSDTVTSGIVSALDRTVEVPGENDKNALLVSAVQTDAAINPGNSGGSMVNCNGQLIGVPSAGATVPSASGESSGGSIGLGFAIPVDLAKTISDEIISTGHVTHAFFGVQTVPVPAAATEGQVPAGLFVKAVVPSGPAEAAGLLAGDVITSVNGQPAASNTQLQEITITKSPGDKIPIDYWRNGHTTKTTITLGTQP